MKKHFAIVLITVFSAILCAPVVFAQASGTVKGECKDAQGNPVADAIVVYINQDNGQKYTLKTNKKGEYFSLGLTAGKYNVSLYKNADDVKANKPLDFVKGFPVSLDENTLNFDQKEQQEKQARGEGLTPEQVKAMQEAQAKQQKETNTVKSLQGKLDETDYQVENSTADSVAFREALLAAQAAAERSEPGISS